MIEIIWDIIVLAFMGAWLAGSAFLGHVLADGNTKIAGRFHAISLLAWFAVASQIYVF